MMGELMAWVSRQPTRESGCIRLEVGFRVCRFVACVLLHTLRLSASSNIIMALTASCGAFRAMRIEEIRFCTSFVAPGSRPDGSLTDTSPRKGDPYAFSP